MRLAGAGGTSLFSQWLVLGSGPSWPGALTAAIRWAF
jgi:hypothetical protein